jgi:hypothetical protein
MQLRACVCCGNKSPLNSTVLQLKGQTIMAVKTNDFNNNGVILHEDNNRVVIATGFTRKSANDKTGDMIQVWILHRTVSPMAAIRTGRDAAICGSCPHRGKRKMVGPAYRIIGRRCYVQVDKAPTGIWRCYRRGRYRHAQLSDYASLFSGRKIRWGAYGDPAFVPAHIRNAVDAVASKRTGYTHQWQDEAHASLKSLVMASVDNAQEAVAAVNNGWRYFRVRHVSEAVLPNETICPASKEGGHRTTCERCLLCDGKRYGDTDKRKNIVIIDHSPIANTQPLINISGLTAISGLTGAA